MAADRAQHPVGAKILVSVGALVLAFGPIACGKGSQATLASIAVAPDVATISAGAQQRFTVVATYSNHTTANVTADVTWSSSNPGVATVDASGLATGVAASAGSTVITASFGGASARSSLTVTPAPLRSIAVAPGTASLAAGLDQQFVATGLYADGTSGPLASGLTWTTSSAASATVDAGTGLVHAVAPGQGITVTATHGPTGLSGRAALTVTTAVLRSIAVSPGSATIAKGLDKQFAASGLYSDGTTVKLSGLRWSSSSDLVATVDSAGLASAVAASPSAVVITATDPASGVSGTAALTVTGAAVTRVTIAPPSATLVAGFARGYSMTGFFSDGTAQAIAASDVAWASSNPAVATFDAGGAGMVYGVAPGSATLSGTHRASGLAAIALLTVTAPDPTQVVQDVTSTPFPGAVGAAGVARFRVTGLTPGAEYLVRVTPPDATLLVQAHAFASFDAPVCTAYAGTVPCRGAVASPIGELFVLAIGLQGTAFTLDVAPLTVVRPTDPPLADAVDTTERYYKVDGLAARGLFQASLGGLTDRAELFVYDGPHGPFGSGELCASLTGTSPSEACTGTVPGSGAVYVTVQGWLTAAGTPFTLAVTP